LGQYTSHSNRRGSARRTSHRTACTTSLPSDKIKAADPSQGHRTDDCNRASGPSRADSRTCASSATASTRSAANRHVICRGNVWSDRNIRQHACGTSTSATRAASPDLNKQLVGQKNQRDSDTSDG
jgi:hypothetical protein